MFFGRHLEVEELTKFINRKYASLIVIKGRRRIGKSTLAEHVGNKAKTFIKIQGLAPRKNINEIDQLNYFAEQLSSQLKIPIFTLNNWTEAFILLGKYTEKGQVVILLDEISWLSTGSKDFAGKLKVAWDTIFKKNDLLTLIICGSVSSWIEENILKSTDFIGRISLTIRLKEISFKESTLYLKEDFKYLSTHDFFSMLSIFGAIPKYLEEYHAKYTLEENIKKLCFTEGGYLFEDFNKIFSDIFGNRSKIYKNIVKVLSSQNLSAIEIAKKLKTSLNGDLSFYLNDLLESNFISRDFAHSEEGLHGNLSKYRLSDNYLRFYLKYIDKYESVIKANSFKFSSLEKLTSWSSILGLQFQNLVVNHFQEIIPLLNIESETIYSASAHFQNKTTRTEACQTDLLISCKGGTRLVCEIKFKNYIGMEVVTQMKKLIATLKFPKNNIKKPILLYSGELDPKVEEADYFYRIVNLEKLIR